MARTNADRIAQALDFEVRATAARKRGSHDVAELLLHRAFRLRSMVARKLAETLA